MDVHKGRAHDWFVQRGQQSGFRINLRLSKECLCLDFYGYLDNLCIARSDAHFCPHFVQWYSMQSPSDLYGSISAVHGGFLRCSGRWSFSFFNIHMNEQFDLARSMGHALCSLPPVQTGSLFDMLFAKVGKTQSNTWHQNQK